MKFGQALESLQDGNKVRRAGWNGKGQFLIYVPGTFGAQLRPGTPYADHLQQTHVDIGAHIDLFNAQGYFQPGWTASQGDMLADDWETIDDESVGQAQLDDSDRDTRDDLYEEAVAAVRAVNRASISFVQRRFTIGYNRAARLIEAMEAAGVITAMSHNGSREVISAPPVRD